MAGHSKYANTKHRKSAQDAKRATVFSKLIREITHSAKQGGPTPKDNAPLRTLVDKALAANMKRETIEKAIARGAGGTEELANEHLRYEGYGPGGVGILIECLTDNRNRTVAELRHAFSKVGCQLACSGSVAYRFERRGNVVVDRASEPALLVDIAIELGALDLRAEDDGSSTIVTSAETVESVSECLRARGIAVIGSCLTLEPLTRTQVRGDDVAKLERLIESVKSLTDTTHVHCA